MLARLRDRIPRPRSLGTSLAALELVSVAMIGRLVGASWTLAALAAVTATAVAHAADLHRRRLVLSALEDVPGLLVGAVAATAVLVLGGLVTSVLVAVPMLAVLVVDHAVAYLVARWRRREGLDERAVVVLGSGDAARHLALTLLARPDLGLAAVGFVSTTDSERLLLRGLPLTLLGPPTSLRRALVETGADTVLVALPGAAGPDEVAAVHAGLAAGADVYALPHQLGDLGPDLGPAARDRIGDVGVFRLARPGPRRAARAARRAVDIVVCAISLAALVPLAVVLAALVRLEAGGVLVRVSARDGRGPRSVARFRTRRSRSLVRPGTTWSVAIPGRCGPVGRLLRRTRLDELPEHLDVLVRRLRGADDDGSAPAPADPHQPEIDAGQLAS